MPTNIIRNRLGCSILLALVTANAMSSTTDLSDTPLVTSSSSSVQPNVFLMMDDSGSMDWDFVPDYPPDTPRWSMSAFGYASNQCNGIYYSPSITYTPPVAADGTYYPNASFTAAWIDGYNTGNGTVDLSSKFRIGLFNSASPPYSGSQAYYYKYLGTQTTATQKKYYDSTSVFAKECSATATSSPRATITISGSASTSVTGITVNGVQIMSGTSTASTNARTVATNIASKIIVSGYSATVSGSTVTITGPNSAAGFTPVITKSGSMTLTATSFSPFVKVLVSSTSGPGGTDERTNFANWFSYYRTRVNMMKTGAGLAFNSLDTHYRVGFATMNNNSGSDLVNLATFDSAQRTAWYNKLYGVTVGNSTPLLKALSRAGQMYAYRLPGNTLNSVTAADPIQYSCQQNFTILSTDGFWNDQTNYDLYGNAVGQVDGSYPRPYKDGGVANTLSDVAMYYYATDLRTSTLNNCQGALGGSVDVCTNNVPASANDAASWQHMTTFTLGLGAFGRMVFSPSYATDTSGDYYSVKNGVIANTGAGVCSWGTNGQPCNWPTPNVSGTPENIDDLWHAAVNGRGSFFSATDPVALTAGLSNALAGISARLGAAAAATTSNPNVTSGDNFVFSSTFDTVIWDGDLIRQQIDLTTGALSSTIDWSAQQQFDASSAARNIYTYDSTNSTSHAKAFQWANLTATEQGYFSAPNIAPLSQFCSSGPTCLSAGSQAAAAGANLVNFLRGDRSNEGDITDISKYYRQRSTASKPHPNSVLGDIVDAEAVYVKSSLFNYVDAGYGDFVTTNKTRAGRVYVASNDGMLHAFDASTGSETWAYIPSFVLPNLFKLADKDYANLHQYFVDGTPTVGDVYFGGAWHTILVGGLNKGGRGYYALDVTTPSATPTVLWEFSDANLGYTFGNPVITKLNDGTWAVLVASGYNNVSPGDGQGRLYVLRASDGSVIRSITTGVGDGTTPSGLAKIATWVDDPMVNNLALRVYGGDLQGNLWSFDINAGTKRLLVTLKDGSGNVQPITVKPELGLVGNTAMVYVGTGRYLGNTDMSDTSAQTFYGIKDKLDGSTYSSSRTGFVQQTQTTTTCPAGTPATVCNFGETVRTSTANTVNLVTDNGWYIDLPDSGERDNTDPVLGLGTIAFTSNVPNASACTSGGYGYRYFLDYATGAPVSTAATVSAVKLGNALGTRPVLVHLPNNTIIELTRMSDGTTSSRNLPIGNSSTNVRRVSFHELTSP